MNTLILSSLIITFLIIVYYYQNSYFVMITLYTLCMCLIYLFNKYILVDWHMNNSFLNLNIDLSPYKARNLYLFLFSLIFMFIFYYFIYKNDIITFLNKKFFFNKEYTYGKDDDDDTSDPEPIPNPDPTPSTSDDKMKCFKSKETNSENKLILFYATWCKYSKDICLEWEEFVESNHPHDLSILAVNCDDTENPPKLASKYNVEGYPSVVLDIAKSGNIYNYNEKINVSKLNNFIKYTCDKEKLTPCLL